MSSKRTYYLLALGPTCPNYYIPIWGLFVCSQQNGASMKYYKCKLIHLYEYKEHTLCYSTCSNSEILPYTNVYINIYNVCL